MASYKNGLVLVPPPTLEKRLEVVQAAREVLAAEHEAARWRRDEIAAVRRELGELMRLNQVLQRQWGELVEWHQEQRRRRDSRLRSHVIKYSADQPRVPAGEHGGGRWTSGGGAESDTRASPAAADLPVSQRGPQYVQAEPATRTDATDGGGNTADASAQQNPKGFFHELYNVTADVIREYILREHRDLISFTRIPDDSPKRPVWLVDDFGQPILDGRGSQLVGPHDLPPDAYVQAGLDAKSRNLADTMHELAQALRGNSDVLLAQDSRLAGLMAGVTAVILPFAHAGSFDAERFDNFYVREYRPYTSVALGIYMAAAGVSREDMLTIADFYAGVFSTFHEDPDPNYPHSAKQDVQDNLLGYELYESGRVRNKN